ncbi:MAG TPA: dienelactone hydrolase family protein [Hyphomicrobiaceae bacterium]|jgi:dienelactone hydrolase|nr:dienelactone hydrolase family protein [Hyphomicrobiaceae bacterium]
MPTQELQYWDKGLRLRGVLACEAAPAAPRPGVLVVHEGLGLNAHIVEQTQRVARLGYVALAADMFGEGRQVRGPPGTQLQEARALVGALRADPAKLRARARAAVAALASLPQVDRGRLGAIGFCFGGSVVLELARDGAPLRAVVSVHGVLSTPRPAAVGGVRASLLVLTGADDPLAPAQEVAAFAEEMRTAKVADWQVISYGNALHGFTNPSADGSILPSARYDARASARAWRAMQGFLAETLDAEATNAC